MIAQQQSAVSVEEKECVICYEVLTKSKNYCVTECGHEFCFACMMKHVQRNDGCPVCRAVVIEGVDDSDDEESESSEIDSEDFGSDEESEGDEEETEYAIEQLEAAFVAKGYGLKDALSLLMYKFSKTDEKYTKAYIKQLEDDIDEMSEELQRECEERAEMGQEDDTRDQEDNLDQEEDTLDQEEEPRDEEAEFQAMIATLD